MLRAAVELRLQLSHLLRQIGDLLIELPHLLREVVCVGAEVCRFGAKRNHVPALSPNKIEVGAELLGRLPGFGGTVIWHVQNMAKPLVTRRISYML